MKDTTDRLTAITIALALALALSGCPASTSGHRTPERPPGQPNPPIVKDPVPPPVARGPVSTAPGREELVQANKLEAAGNAMGARRVLRVLARKRPDSAEGYQARHRLAAAALARGNPERAEALTQKTLAPTVDAGLAFVGWTLRGEALEGLGRFDGAIDAYKQALIASGDDSVKTSKAKDGAARATFMAGDPSKAAQVLGQPDAVVPALKRLITPMLGTRAALERLYGKVPASSPWSAWVALKLAREHLARGDMRKAETVAKQARERGDPSIKQEAAVILDTVAAWDTVRPQSVGVLLPLSGKYQRLGQAALEAIQLALGKGSGVRLVVRDTKGDAKIAAQHAEALILSKNVGALLGPIGEKESAASVLVSARFGVPHMVLSRRHDIGAGKPTVFRLRLSRVELGKSLARYAFRSLNVRRVAILYPDNKNGFRHMASFWDEIVRLGGEVRAVESYKPGTSRFNPVVRALLGAQKRSSAKTDFEGLFIPDQALTVRRIVPFLKYWGVFIRNVPGAVGTRRRPAVQLLGSEGWNHPSLIDPGEHLTDNAVFVAPFFPDPSDARAEAFALAFKQRYSKAPITFHAEVFDATSFLALSVVKARGMDHKARGQILESLRSRQDFVGATGPIAVSGENSLVRPPQILTVDLDTIRRRGTLEEELKRRAERRKTVPTAK